MGRTSRSDRLNWSLLVVLGAATFLLAAPPADAFQPFGQRGTGSPGDGAGELSSPYQPAVDSAGNLWVADSGNSRIAEFAPDGTFIKAIGKDVGGLGLNVCTTTCLRGTDDGSAGSMCFADGLGIDPLSGDLVVGDECNNRIEVFTQAGIFVRAFGADVVPGGTTGPEICTTDCQAGLSDDSGGGFGTPVEIAIDPAGNVFVGDEDNNRIDVVEGGGMFQ